MESASIARLANSRIPSATRNANYVNPAGTKIKQEHPNAKCAWKEGLLLLDLVNALKVVVVMVATLLRQRPAVAAMFVR